MSKETSEEGNWIRLVRHVGDHWPFYTHPDYPDHELDIQGAFRVRWSDGVVSIEEIRIKNVTTLSIRGSEEMSGVFKYFERDYNGLDLIHELHEIELLEEEVARCVINLSQAACASA